jgi:hypothetical protein
VDKTEPMGQAYEIMNHLLPDDYFTHQPEWFDEEVRRYYVVGVDGRRTEWDLPMRWMRDVGADLSRLRFALMVREWGPA